MPRCSRVAISVLGIWIGLVNAGPRPAVAADDFAFYHENVMGTSLELRVRADDAEAARRAEGRVLREIDRLSAIFSGYDPSSEFSRWQSAPSQGPAKVSPELFEMLLACDRWLAWSGGAFDPRVEALSRLWSGCTRQGRTPTPEERAGVVALSRRPAWRLDPGSRTAERLSDCPLTLNAIAKGYIVERACAAAMEGRGVRGLMLNVGGDLRTVGEMPWTIAIAAPKAGSETIEPLARVEVRDRAVATSGRHLRGTEIGGRWYSHIIDPRSGVPADATAIATVIAERSADADALATALNVLAPEDGIRLADSLPGVECLIVTADGRTARSDGWQRYERARPSPLPLPPTSLLALADEGAAKASASPRAAWGDEFEMLVNFEVNRPDAEGGRYRRPYVAIWVEDKEGFPVRNLLLWVSLGGAGPWQWLPDLTRWHRVDQVRKRVDKRDMVLTMSQPTRPPGKYSVLWDGKDDHGKPLERGTYTLCIDAAREHGTYQDLRTQVTLGDEPFTVDLKGGVEIKSASVAARRKIAAK